MSRSIQGSGPGRPTLRDNGSGLSSSGSVFVLEVFDGETAVLPCPPPPSDPPATLTFFKDGKPVINNGKVFIPYGDPSVIDSNEKRLVMDYRPCKTNDIGQSARYQRQFSRPGPIYLRGGQPHNGRVDGWPAPSQVGSQRSSCQDQSSNNYLAAGRALY